MARTVDKENVIDTSEGKEIVKVTRPTFDKNADPVSELNKRYVAAEKRKKELHQYYKRETKVPMYLSPMYRPYTGNVMRVMVNGISIYFKVDGSTQMIPKTFADEVVRRRKAIDRQVDRQKKMARVPDNNESAPGELNLF